MSKGDSEVLDPVTIGDLIVLNATEPRDCVGALSGDSASFHVGIQLPNFQQQKREPLQYDDYVFRVCPALNYRQRNELDVHEQKSTGKQKGPGKLKRTLSVGKLIKRDTIIFICSKTDSILYCIYRSRSSKQASSYSSPKSCRN